MFGWETIVGCLFAAACIAFLPAIRQGERKEWFLAGVSAAVLAAWQPTGLLITLGMTVIAWLTIRGRGEGKGAFPALPIGAGVFLLLLPLVLSKSTALIHTGSGAFAGGLERWFVPLGLSFTAFRLVGILLDHHALKIPVSPSRLALLALFFPTFPSGPITTLQSLKDLGKGTSWSSEFRPAGERILLGISRKVLLADSLKQYVIDPWLARGVGQMEPYQCLALPVLFGMQVYWDFAGYSDMAIGIARLLGYQVPENFNRPFTSRSLVEFWRRWHITLSEWIRIRLMMKIAGRRAGLAKLSFAAIISMAICGLWHGFGPGFLLWGVWHGAGLVCVHLFGEAKKRSMGLQSFTGSKSGPFVSTVLTFVYVTIGWIWFFLPIGDGLELMRRCLQWRGGAIETLLPVGLAVLLLAVYAAGDRGRGVWDRLHPAARGTALAGLLGLVTYAVLFRQGVAKEFIYTQF